MLKVNYPVAPNELEEMYRQYLTHFNVDEMQTQLHDLFSHPKLRKFRKHKVKDILLAQIEDLFKLSIQLNKVLKSMPAKMQSLKTIFNYDKAVGKKRQPAIARFFMDQTELDISTCFFCNVDYINSFNDVYDYPSVFDLVKRGSKADLTKIQGLNATVADTILKQRANIHSPADLTPAKLMIDKRYVDKLKEMKVKEKYNHFTLDHVLNKADFPIAALSLYNFVPCCYNCNSKFKRSQLLLTDRADISPTSKNFSLPDNVKFKILFSLSTGNKFEDIAATKDFNLDFDISKSGIVYENYLSVFKLRARYVIHKKEVLRLLEKRKTYSESQINEIARITGKSVSQVYKDIFGKELYENNPELQPLTKLKRDISKDIGIAGVI